MGLKKTQDPNINPQAPWENDDLHREREGDLLTRLIESLTGSYVIALKGDWGTGKSVFLRRLSANLENSGIPVIPIDAWRTDYLEDPLIAFVAATEQRIAEERSRSDVRIEKGKSIARGLAKYAGRLSPSLIGVVAESLVPGAGAVSVAVTETVERGGEAVLDAIKTKRDAEERFRELLSAARDYLTKRPMRRPVRPIVVAIDELDRCRPSYAVKVLERIKHFFDVPGIVFVIATDGLNLPSAVGSVYGEKIDGEMYLRKFFDYEFDLEEPESSAFSKALAAQFDFNELIASSPFVRDKAEKKLLAPSDNGYGHPVSVFDRGLDAFEILAAFPFFARKMHLSLRDQAQAFTLVNAYLRTLRGEVMVYPTVLAFAYCLRFSQPQTYSALKSGKIALKGIFDSSPGRPPIMPGSAEWIDSTIYGLELTYFWNALGNPKPIEYIGELRRNIYQQSIPSMERMVAADKLFFRVSVDKRLLSQFLPRAFKLADAFG